MITRTPGIGARTPAWRVSLRDAVSSVGELADRLGLEVEELPVLRHADTGDGAVATEILRRFPLRVPLPFVARMRPGDPDDPLLAQVLPLAAEGDEAPGYTVDPLGELAASPTPGLLHKYRGRALLVVTGACAVHCRYCFRRHFPYAEHIADWAPALEHIAADGSIEEVILSGGDPLVLADDRLAALASQIAAIPHVRRLRLHTRLPIVIPERIDAALTDWLASTPQPVVVLHANHAREIDGAVARAVGRLRSAGAVVLNQSVLLRGVNDTVTALVDLSKTLFEAGIMPYYLHVMDRVLGAAHYDVPLATARDLVREAQTRLPGYLVPRLVREQAGAPSKTPIDLSIS